MATLDAAVRMLREHQPQDGWTSPEADAVLKTAEQPQGDEDDDDARSDDDNQNDNTQESQTQPGSKTSGVPVRVGRSQSLTDPKTSPMFLSPTNNDNNNNNVLAVGSELEVGTAAAASSSSNASTQPLSSEAESLLKTPTAPVSADGKLAPAPHANPAPLVTQQQLTSDPRFARRNRRSMSAEFTLSMLQQELGYPTRKSSRRDSIERRSRRASSMILEEELSSGDDAAPSSLSTIASSSQVKSDGAISALVDSNSNNNYEPEPECRPMSRRYSIESATAGTAYYISTGSDCGTKKRGSYDDANATEVSDDEIAHCGDSSIAAAAADDDEEEENFMDSRIASVTGFSQDTDGIVYYEIIVRSVAHGPLSAYKVRRRYSEFRDLHRALSGIMKVSRKAPQLTELVNHLHSDHHHLDEASVPFSPATVSKVTYQRDHLLPPLPDRGGIWSYLQFDTTPFLERRAKYFEALLVACQNHSRARESRLLNEFLGPPPDSVALHTSVENSYVSLNRFAAPKLRLSVEAQERKQKARNISRRRSSVHRAASAAECC